MYIHVNFNLKKKMADTEKSTPYPKTFISKC